MMMKLWWVSRDGQSSIDCGRVRIHTGAGADRELDMSLARRELLSRCADAEERARIDRGRFSWEEVTIEAEYGLDVVEGSLLTLAHHGPREGR